MNLVTLLSVCVYYASILTCWKNSKTLCGILSPLSCRCQDGIQAPPEFYGGRGNEGQAPESTVPVCSASLTPGRGRGGGGEGETASNSRTI